MDVPLVSANLATVAVESLLYGIFLVLDITSITLLFTRENSFSPGTTRTSSFAVMQRPMFIGAVILLVSITGVSQINWNLRPAANQSMADAALDLYSCPII